MMVALILCSSLPFALVNMKFVYQCDCVIKCKMLVNIYFKRFPAGIILVFDSLCLEISIQLE